MKRLNLQSDKIPMYVPILTFILISTCFCLFISIECVVDKHKKKRKKTKKGTDKKENRERI